VDQKPVNGEVSTCTCTAATQQHNNQRLHLGLTRYCTWCGQALSRSATDKKAERQGCNSNFGKQIVMSFLGSHCCWGRQSGQWTWVLQLVLMLIIYQSCHLVLSLECNISAAEMTALQALYNSTNGDSWISQVYTRRGKWGPFPSPLSEPCSVPWFGLTCTPEPSLTGQCGIDIIQLSCEYCVTDALRYLHLL
jgi:hypothetical protein